MRRRAAGLVARQDGTDINPKQRSLPQGGRPTGVAIMKFVQLNSRGGDYLVVVANVAWLRTAENGQTQVGMVGGDALLVAGTIEETAARILAG
jgi:hypothetical protein